MSRWDWNGQTSLQRLMADKYTGEAFVVFEQHCFEDGMRTVGDGEWADEETVAFTCCEDALGYAERNAGLGYLRDLLDEAAEMESSGYDVAACVMNDGEVENDDFETIVEFSQDRHSDYEIWVSPRAELLYPSRVLAELVGLEQSCSHADLAKGCFSEYENLYCVLSEVVTPDGASKQVSQPRYFKDLENAQVYAKALSKADNTLWRWENPQTKNRFVVSTRLVPREKVLRMYKRADWGRTVARIAINADGIENTYIKPEAGDVWLTAWANAEMWTTHDGRATNGDMER